MTVPFDIDGENVLIKGGWTFVFNPKMAPATNKNKINMPTLEDFSPYALNIILPKKI